MVLILLNTKMAALSGGHSRKYNFKINYLDFEAAFFLAFLAAVAADTNLTFE